jgi:prevent-host-death family protein
LAPALEVYTLRCTFGREVIVKTATAKELRLKTATLLKEVRSGQRILITYRGKSIAVLAPAEEIDSKPFDAIGFGLWRDRKEMTRVDAWLGKLRGPRFRR